LEFRHTSDILYKIPHEGNPESENIDDDGISSQKDAEIEFEEVGFDGNPFGEPESEFDEEENEEEELRPGRNDNSEATLADVC